MPRIVTHGTDTEPMDRLIPEPVIPPPDEEDEPAVPVHVPPKWIPEEVPEPIEPEEMPKKEPLVPA